MCQFLFGRFGLVGGGTIFVICRVGKLLSSFGFWETGILGTEWESFGSSDKSNCCGQRILLEFFTSCILQDLRTKSVYK